MQQELLTIEQIDRHLESPAPSGLSEKDFAATDFFDKINQVGTIYQKVRPILAFAKALLFFKPKWQAVLADFIANLDLVYGTQS